MTKERSVTLEELSSMTGAALIGDPAVVIRSFADLLCAGEDQASFLSHPRYRKALQSTRAGAIFIQPDAERPEGKNYLLHPEPSEAIQALIDYLYDPEENASGFERIHPSAVVHPSAVLGENVRIGPHVTIDRGTTIGDGTEIDAGSYLGPYVVVGKQCRLYARVVIRERCIIGDRVVIQPGAVIGSCGFGFSTKKDGCHRKLLHAGRVVIEDDVEIGANTTIDRGRIQDTRIGMGTKIDNLVQVAHGVEIGKHCLFAAQTGIAGSTKIGNHCRFGGQIAINGHIEIADEVAVAATSAVPKSLEKGVYAGIPVLPIAQHHRMIVFLKKIESFAQRIKKLEES